MPNTDKMLDVIKSVNEIRALAESKSAETAEVKAQIKAIGDDAALKFEEVQKNVLAIKQENNELKSAQDKFKADYADLYKKANRLALGGSDSEESVMHRKYSSEMDAYLRKGVTPNSDALDEISYHMAKKAMATQNEDEIKSAARIISNETGDSLGYLTFGKKAMATGNNPDGGYLTAPDRRTDITVDRIFETSPMRALANVVTTTSNSVEFLIDDNESTSGGWVGESTIRGGTDQAKIGRLEIMVHEQFAQPKATQKMLDDGSINIEAWLSDKTNDILRRTENTAFVSGDGSQKPRGFLSLLPWAVNGTYERNKLEQINSGSSGLVTADGLITLQISLLEEYQASAVFLMKRTTFGEVSKLKDGTGAYLLNTMILPQGVDMTVLGKPVFFADDMQAAAPDALAITYGDFNRGYAIIDRMGIRVLRDPFTDKPFIKFYTTKRVGGDVVNYQAIKIQKLAA